MIELPQGSCGQNEINFIDRMPTGSDVRCTGLTVARDFVALGGRRSHG